MSAHVLQPASAFAPQEGGLVRERVRGAIDEVLARPEFRPESKGLGAWVLEKVADALRWLADLFGFDFDLSPSFLHALLYVLLAIALALLVWLLLRRWSAGRGGRVADVAPGEDPDELRRRRVADLRAAARRAAAQADHVRALRLYFTALVIGLSERGDLEYRDAWTNRELFERGAPHTEAARELGALVPALDRKSFGGEPAQAADVERLAALCERWLGKAAAAR